MPFFIIFIGIPFFEVLIFMAVGESIGFMTTLMLALLTAVIGGAIVRHQGFQTVREIQIAMGRGKVPLNELFDGICLIAAGATLITPGFLTDTIGFLLLIPPVRNGIRHVIQEHTSWGMTPSGSDSAPHGQASPRQSSADIIEGDYERLDERD